MIKTAALRLNNTVAEGGRLCRVVQLASESVLVQYLDGEISEALAPEELEAVPLTPMLLEQSGFTPTGDRNAYRFVLDDEAVITVNPHIFGGHSVQLCVKGNWCGKPVKFLHELQNIYMDLTGEELAVD